MKTTNQIKAELKTAYQCAMEVSILDMKAPLRYIDRYIAEDVSGYGTAADEKVFSREDYKKMAIAARKQSKGIFFSAKITTPFRPRFIDEYTVKFHDELQMQIGENENKQTFHFHFSTLFKYRLKKWQLLMFHGSMPDAGSSIDDTFHFGEAEKRLKELEEVVAQRTHDLEEKNKELEIEASLERVRAKSLAMHHTSELQQVIHSVHKELINLKIAIEGGSFIAINSEIHNQLHCWGSGGTANTSKEVIIPVYKKHFLTNLINGIKKGPGFFTEKYTKQEKIDFFTFLFKHEPWSKLAAKEKKETLSAPGGYTRSCCVSLHSSIFIINHLGRQFSDAENEILKKFGKVFEQSYTRFLDLQKVEAQAREALIEAALEKVRSRSLAMHKSNELKEVIRLVLTEIRKLDILAEHAGFYIDYKFHDDMHIWLADPNLEPFFTILPYFDSLTWNNFLEAKAKGTSLHTDLLDFKAKNKFYKSLFKLFTLPEEAKQFYMQCKGLAVSTVLLDSIGLYIENFEGKPYSNDENKILLRFGKVFQQTYTRFLDLEKAEAQTREAQIEASLEKVRTVALTMKKSDEMLGIAQSLYEQLVELGFTNIRNAIIDLHNDNDETFWDYDYSAEMGGTVTLMSYYEDSIIEKQVKQIESASDAFFELVLEGDDLQYLIDMRIRNGEPEDPRLRNIKQLTYNLYSFGNGGIGISNFGLLSDDQKQVLKRFRNVFAFAYKRYSDMVQAEVQAREGQIQLALERIRARTMAMQKSVELTQTADLMCEQLKQLGAELQGVAFAICDEDNLMVRKWTSMGEFSHPYNIEPGEERMFNAWKNHEEIYEEVYEGEKQRKYYEAFMQIPDFKKGVQKLIDTGQPIPSWQMNHAVSFQHGYLLFITTKPFKETHIFIRFGKVFDQTYTRFLDLQIAESNARETLKQAALDRIRADIASMRTSKDLERITPLIWNELKILGVPFIRCGVFILDEEQQLIQTFLSTPEGKAIAAFHLPFDTPGNIQKVLSNWKVKQIYTDHWMDEDFKQFAEILVQQGAMKTTSAYLQSIPQGGFFLHFLPFLQGMLYVGNSTQFGDDEIDLLQTVAGAFSTAYSRFEDFNKLEIAKKQVDSTLTELQATQKQLIQSEKMASLGELTAGIAHEIQNPLNFVNNFSEVSSELVDEMNQEISNGNIENAREIGNDLKENLKKINHHGKRAGDIVQGMLQHSRKSEGKKEPTDINALCDEYLRLAYHGLRAKDKSFNAKFETHFDQSIPKINLVSQDIGRVILNLINNAFYAVNERRKKGEPGFEALVGISTKKEKNKVLIRVKDNGTGIPQNIVDKIFQPFFTTKPAGEGTGLGLSLSYDIVKAQGGEIKVESSEGKGTEFTIQFPV